MPKRKLIHNLCEKIIEKKERELIESLLLKISEKVLRRIEIIKVDHESTPTRPGREPIDAEYDCQTRIITIYATPFNPKYECYLYHEIGHCIFHEFEDVAQTAKIECQEGERNELELLCYGNDVETWASEFCANGFELFKSKLRLNERERYQAMIEYFDRNEF